jgi:hypothetical protein
MYYLPFIQLEKVKSSRRWQNLRCILHTNVRTRLALFVILEIYFPKKPHWCDIKATFYKKYILSTQKSNWENMNKGLQNKQEANVRGQYCQKRRIQNRPIKVEGQTMQLSLM